MATYRVFKLEITAENAAFCNGLDIDDYSRVKEVARILRKLADDFDREGRAFERLSDSNGNVCGVWKLVNRREG